MKDFITIFREDEASEKLIYILNEEINTKNRRLTNFLCIIELFQL